MRSKPRRLRCRLIRTSESAAAAMIANARSQPSHSGTPTVVRPRIIGSRMLSAPWIPRILSIRPWNPSSPARVTTKDGIPT